MKKKLKLYAVMISEPGAVRFLHALIAHKNKKSAITHYMGMLDSSPDAVGVAIKVKLSEPGTVEIPGEIIQQMDKDLNKLLAKHRQLAN